MENLLIEAGIGVALVAAIVEALKRAGMRSKYAPLANLGLGLVIASLLGYVNNYTVELVILMWASLSGVAALGYDGVRKAVENIAPEKELLSLERRASVLRKQIGKETEA